ncbi:translation initiation factor IF-2 [Salaquimonas pukyongi]|uniref:translation initiation factor IF-2 n=1 Tax=Salaquimonas pukyongi TaxID=2712698 RepID=UPI00096B9D77|nr:translation initiation factor IF-2 [Salaquimonas pukyongi]
MSEENNDEKLSVKPKKTLSLRGGGVSQGTVNQSFSRGRTKAVVVETRKRRINKPGDTPKPADKAPAAPAAAPAQADEAASNLSQSELEARRRALEEAKARQSEEEIKAAEEAAKRAELDARRKADREEQKRREEEAAKREAEQRTSQEMDAAAAASAAQAAADPDAVRKPVREEPKPKELKPFERKRSTEDDRTPSRPKGGDDRRRTKLTLTNALDSDRGGKGPSLAALRRRQEKAKRAALGQTGPREKISREVKLPETITIQDLASRMSERSVDVIKYLMKQGQMMKPGDVIDADTAELIASEFGHTVKRVSESDVEEGLFDTSDNPENMVSRPPVVTIMGHVDHGKTSLLDAIRNANVVKGEAGGITQHIGAYQVDRDGQRITFIDTPGHEAFTAMRARGAMATDIAILVVAADDGVMPQTIESINHAKAAEVPIIVAINKIDKESADPNKVKTELLQHEVFVESMGGETQEVEVSALKGTNLDSLLDAILLQSEVLELKADPDRPAEGTIIESQLDKGRGPVATVLVKRGTLRTGDIVIAGNEWGKVRALVNDHGEQVDEATPSTPVEILGLSGAPSAGERFTVVENEARAREISDYRQRLARDKAVAQMAGSRGSLEQMISQLQTSELKEAAIVVKGDVQGSVEAIEQALAKMNTEEVAARVVHGAVGGITESDVSLAAASNAPILAFNVRANKQAKEAAEREGIEIRYYSIIYDLVDDMKQVMSGMLAPERRETFLGYAEILEVFNVSKVGKVAGCRVSEGKVERGSGVRLLRDNVVIHEGKLSTLKRFKDEVSEVPAGQECGMAFENYQDIRQGDQIECFRVEHIERSL